MRSFRLAGRFWTRREFLFDILETVIFSNLIFRRALKHGVLLKEINASQRRTIFTSVL